MRKLLLIILPLILLTSCSVQKRKYQKGFHVSNYSGHKQKSTTHISKKEIENETSILKTTVLPANNNEDIELSASIDNKVISFQHTALNLLIKTNDSICDIITLKNGEDVKAAVMEITPVLIKYKKCNEPDGPLYIVKKTDVFSIKYSNGIKDLITTETPIQQNSKNPNTENKTNKYPQQTHPLAIWALVSFILGFITLGIGFIVSFFLAKQALKNILANPEVFKGYKLANWIKLASIRILMILLTLILLNLIIPQ
jgi:hypothetical protein